MGWVEEARAKHSNAFKLLRQAADNASISVPVATSRYTAPGWLFLGESFYTYPDVTYPWDAAVIAAIREVQPDAVPVTIRSVWQHANYGQMERPIVLVRHGIARSIRNPVAPVHRFRCEMPYAPMLELRTSVHELVDLRPNYIEVNWHDRGDRRYGKDLPGAYIPCDWELYYALYERAVDFNTMKLKPVEWAQDELIEPHVARERRREEFLRGEDEAVQRELEAFYCLQPSDVELKERMLAPYENPKPAPRMVVPDLSAVGA